MPATHDTTSWRIYINCRRDSLMRTRTRPKRTAQQAVNFGPNLLVVDAGCESSIVRSAVGPRVRPRGRWPPRSAVLPSFPRRPPDRPTPRRRGNLYRVIHRILVRGRPAAGRSLHGRRRRLRRRKEISQSLFRTPALSAGRAQPARDSVRPDRRLPLIRYAYSLTVRPEKNNARAACGVPCT